MADFKNLAWATSFATRASRKLIYLPYRASGKKSYCHTLQIQCLYTQSASAYKHSQCLHTNTVRSCIQTQSVPAYTLSACIHTQSAPAYTHSQHLYTHSQCLHTYSQHLHPNTVSACIQTHPLGKPMNCQSATVNKACSCAVGSTSSIIGCVVCLCGRRYLPQRNRSTVKCARPGSPSQGHDAVKRAKESLPSL